MYDLNINYSLTNLEVLAFPFVSAYGLRHLEKEGWLNKLIGVIELFPILGPVVALIEGIVMKIFQKPEEIPPATSSSSFANQAASRIWIEEFKTKALAHFDKAKESTPEPVTEISLTPEQENLLKQTIAAIHKYDLPKNVTVHGENSAYVFSINEIPNLIFKCAKSENQKKLLPKRFADTAKAQGVIYNKNLYLLRTPQQKLCELEGSQGAMLIEQKFDILPSYSEQRTLFQYCVNDPDLKPFIQECAKQLIILIIETGYSDVNYNNNPILSNGQGLGLIDMDNGQALGMCVYSGPSPTIGLSKGCGDRSGAGGILNCLSSDMLIALEPELKQLLTDDQFQQLKFSNILEGKRASEESNQKFAVYLKENKIVTCREPVNLQGSVAEETYIRELEEDVNGIALSNLGICPIEERKFYFNTRTKKEPLDWLKNNNKIFDWTPSPSGYGFHVWA